MTRYAKSGESDPQLMCEELMEDCLAKGSRDNMSAIVVLFDEAQKLVAEGQPGVLGMRAEREAVAKGGKKK